LNITGGAQMTKINKIRTFDGYKYQLIHVNLYKSQADHYAEVTRSKTGGSVRVVKGSCMAGDRKISNCWRVYQRLIWK